MSKIVHHISVRGARTHNLQNINVDIPRDKLVVITGISGSGKSSLAFDTLYADGQRRYIESLSTYARQFLSTMDKPDVDHIEGLSPAISIEQKATSHNPRSTVGTVTEIYDYLRLLYARVGEPRCPAHGVSLSAQTVSQMVDLVLTGEKEQRLLLLAPMVEGRKGEHNQVFEQLMQEGFIRARVDGRLMQLEGLEKLDARKKHTIEAVVDRLRVRPDARLRLAESFETALRLSDGVAKTVVIDDAAREQVFSSRFACHRCGYSVQELQPRLFSFNNPTGACSECDGIGSHELIDPERVVQDPGLSLPGGAIRGWDISNEFYCGLLHSLADHYGFDINRPFGKLPRKIQKIILYGSGREKIRFKQGAWRFKRRRKAHVFEGIIPNLERRYRDSHSPRVREDITNYLSNQPCRSCQGSRLNETARNVFIQDRALHEITALSVAGAQHFFSTLQWSGHQAEIADKIIREVDNRLKFLINVGLDYLTLDRSAETLSGGEAQRIRLASQIGAGLVGVMYVLDEPSIGLHQRDNQRLLETLFHLRDLGNTVLVVEHDEQAIRSADYLLDIGPGAGAHGGRIVGQGSAEQVASCPDSLTGQYLSGTKSIPLPKRRRRADTRRVIQVFGASGNNLQSVQLTIPLGLFSCVTGVSGSGKSTLVNDTLYRVVLKSKQGAYVNPAPYTMASGLEQIKSVIDIDQSPIGRTPRSNPATYTGLFTPLRELYAQIPEARSRGYKPGRFSFNISGGRCEACRGDGLLRVEMHFLPDVYVSCDVCAGRRYNRETLDVRYKGFNIAEVLEMTVEKAMEVFSVIPAIARRLQTLMDVGLSYIHLGQSATTLSGGEAQRIKLARELSKRDTGATLYILDEPTTGLHFHDIHQLLGVLQRLCDRGNTVVVIEHNLDVIKTADWIIDLGPEGGAGGGKIVAQGTPERVAARADSHTGCFLAPLLAAARNAGAGAG